MNIDSYIQSELQELSSLSKRIRALENLTPNKQRKSEDSLSGFVAEVTSQLKIRLEDPSFTKPIELVKSK